jgi:hypothetical protein
VVTTFPKEVDHRSTPERSQRQDNQEHMSTAEVVKLLAEQQAKSSEMMMEMIKQMTDSNTQQLAIQQAEIEKSKERSARCKFSY